MRLPSCFEFSAPLPRFAPFRFVRAQLKRSRRYDYVLALVVLSLTAFGVVVVFSATYYSNQMKGTSLLRTGVVKQLLLSVAGIVAMTVASMFSYKYFSAWRIRVPIPIRQPYPTKSKAKLLWRSWEINANMDYEEDLTGKIRISYSFPLLPALILAAAYGMLVYCLFYGTLNGASRWISVFGISIQPSEIARLGTLLFVADDLAANRVQIQRCDNFGAFLKLLIPSFAVVGMTTVLILAGKSMSMAMTVLFMFLLMLWAAGVRKNQLLILIGLGVALAVGLIVMEPFRMKRLAIFRDPWTDPKGDGYQLVQSLYALANGGLLGAGAGGGKQKFLYLTYGDSDFILANIGEEFGLVGVTLLIAVYAVLVIRGYSLAIRADDRFGAMTAFGITSVVWVQMLLHVLVVTASMPPTGLPLPFISAGGSSLVLFLTQAGILLNVSTDSKLPVRKRNRRS